MAVTTNLYPPIINDVQAAFVRTEDCKVYFSLSSFNSLDDIKHVQVSLINQATNQTAFKSNLYPLGIKFINSISTVVNPTDDFKYYITINNEDLINNEFGLNQFYKIQIRFGDIAAPASPTATWVNDNINHFSEWSKVCLIKGIEQPHILINTLDQEGLTTFFIPPTEFVGRLYYEQNAGIEKQTLKSYNIDIYKGNHNTVIKSDQIYTNQYSPNEIYYELSYDLERQINYTLVFNYTTSNLYKETVQFQFKIAQQATNDLNATIEAVPEVENGSIKINIDFTSTNTTKNLIIRRSSSKTNFTQWENLKTLVHNNNIKHLWYDTTIESGIWYKYRIQQDAENGKISEISEPVICLFEDIFLTEGKKQLKIQFNPSVSDFKYNVSESQQVTLGSKYPYLKRNGNNYFRSFSLSGLISALVDEICWYDPGLHNGSIYNKNSIQPFATPKELYGGAATASLYQQYNNLNDINSYQDYIYEREFRQKVLDFLYKNNIKLFRSLTEGNILVKLTNIALQPIETLGRRLYSFSATAIEIDDNILNNLIKYNLINKLYYTYARFNITDNFKSGESLIEKFYSVSTLPEDVTNVMELIIDHQWPQNVIIYAKPINNMRLIRYEAQPNEPLRLYYSDSDPIAESYFYGIHINEEDITCFDDYYSQPQDITDPIEYGVYYIASQNVFKIDRYIAYYQESDLLSTYYDETVKNQKEDYALLVEPEYIRMIYYNNNWYSLLDNNDIILESIPASIGFVYRIKKED